MINDICSSEKKEEEELGAETIEALTEGRGEHIHVDDDDDDVSR